MYMYMYMYLQAYQPCCNNFVISLHIIRSYMYMYMYLAMTNIVYIFIVLVHCT